MLAHKGRYLGFLGGFLASALFVAGPATGAAYGDQSPVLLIESGPSDNPNYRRMVFVKYLAGDQVRVNYKAYNRSEFRQMSDATPRDIIRACTNGPSTSLADLQAFERADALAQRRGQPPQVARFCIKNIPGWEAGNRTRYLDPIFNGMPQAARFN